MVSGVPSFCAAAAALNRDLVLGEQNLHIFCASDDNLDQFLALKGTRVFMKGPSSMAKIIKTIKERDLDASLVSNCGMKNEVIEKSITKMDDETRGYYTLIITKEDEE
jgi:precorrin-2/cobalt-factor-2 C20-methyltransferase